MVCAIAFDSAFGWACHIQKRAHNAYVPTFSRFSIPLRRSRPHEPSSRPPCRPSPRAVAAGGHCAGRSKRKCAPRVEDKAAKRGERSFPPSFNDTILHFILIIIYVVRKQTCHDDYMPHVPPQCDRGCYSEPPNIPFKNCYLPYSTYIHVVRLKLG